MDNSFEKKSRVLVDLDSLLDTRLSLIYQKGPGFTDRALSANYYQRSIDSFPGFTFQKFREAYNARDKTVLQNAVLTKINFFIREFVLTTLQQVSNTPFHMKPVILVNTHPYILSELEENSIIKAVVSMTGQLADVGTVHMAPENITPKYVKRDINLMVMYEGAQWVETQSSLGGFSNITCPDVGLICPALMFKEPDKKALEECKRIGKTPFQAFEELSSPLVGLKFIDVEHFCIDLKVKPVSQVAERPPARLDQVTRRL